MTTTGGGDTWEGDPDKLQSTTRYPGLQYKISDDKSELRHGRISQDLLPRLHALHLDIYERNSAVFQVAF
jgi:hypothetical protein